MLTDTEVGSGMLCNKKFLKKFGKGNWQKLEKQ